MGIGRHGVRQAPGGQLVSFLPTNTQRLRAVPDMRAKPEFALRRTLSRRVTSFTIS
jgi:hypothetical protein